MKIIVCFIMIIKLICEPGGTRTRDQKGISFPLYQLSYRLKALTRYYISRKTVSESSIEIRRGGERELDEKNVFLRLQEEQ